MEWLRRGGIGSAGPRSSSRGPRSVRSRLLAISLLPTIVILPLLLTFTMTWWNEKFDRLLISKVSSDLTIARQYLGRILEHSGEKVRSLGASDAFVRVAHSDSPNETSRFLESNRKALDLDFLYLVNSRGEITSSAPAERAEVDLMRWPVIASALAGKGATVIDVLDAHDLERLSPELRDRARLELVPTRAARPTDRRAETRGMIVHTAMPARLRDGQMGALVGGILLNNNIQFIDSINDLVYTASGLPENSRGTATLFLDDVRISTNVRLFGASRALGTRVSNSVREAVLGQGRIWLDRAFVVNDWYISAYEPIVDSHDNRVGMLYVGFLERPFRIAKLTTLIAVLLAFFVATFISVPMFLNWARGIFKPLERMTKTIHLVESGDLNARTNLGHADDEIGVVANHFDELLDQIQERDRELREWAIELNNRVESRTAELRSANERLRATTKQLATTSKLAAIGEIAAGVAHEINNPIAIIQGNLDVVRREPGAVNENTKKELALIDAQVHRINQIVSMLLQFAKPSEFAGYAERQNPSEVVGDCLLLCRHLLSKTSIRVVREDVPEHVILINRTELQQVVLNLIVNAIHAMPDGGVLTFRTRKEAMNDVAGVAIQVSDTGEGMSPAVMKKIFDPFFTTKSGEGTGLGLSISQTIIRRWDGLLSVQSEPGQGATFTIWLPEVPACA